VCLSALDPPATHHQSSLFPINVQSLLKIICPPCEANSSAVQITVEIEKAASAVLICRILVT